MCNIKQPSFKDVKVNGRSSFKWLILAASLITTNVTYAQVPAGAAQAFVSPVVTGAGAPAAPETAPTTTEAAPTPAAAKGTTAKPSPYLFLTAPYIGFSLGPRVNANEVPSLYNAIEGTLSLGVEAMVTTRFYLGGEIFFGNSLQLQNRKNNSNVKTNWSYGLDIIPGFVINTFMLTYLRVGVASTHFLGQHSSSTAWRFGYGVEANAFCKKWYVRGEYVYSSYNSMSHVIRPRTGQVNIGVVYKFL